MNIRVDLNTPIYNGMEVVFRSPVDCSQVTGLKVYYDGGSQEFAFADAHGNNVGDIPHLFAENVVVKVILDVTTSMAFVQNADTNAYLEWRFKDTIDKCCPPFTESGCTVNCEPVEGYPLGVVSKIEPVQAGSGDTSPENVRPISGYSAVNVWRGGKNLFDFVGMLGDENYTNTIHGVTAEVKDGMVHMYGTNEHTTYINPLTSPRFENTLYPLPAGTYTTPQASYTYNGKTYKISLSVQLYDHDAKKNTNYSGTFTTTKTLYLVYFFAAVDFAEHTLDVTFPLTMVAGTEIPTEYEPYRGENFAIDLGQTVYGGSFDWNSGVLTINGALIDVNPDTLSFQGTDATGFAHTQDKKNNGSPMDVTHNGLCNRLPYKNVGVGVGIASYSFHPGGIIRLRFPNVASLEEAKAWVAENPLQIYYKLAEPITIQLTPQEILALSGVNTLYSYTGDTEVTGRADPTAVIQKLTNAILALGGNI